MGNNSPDEIIDPMSIDCLIFGFRNSNLEILLVLHGEGISKGRWALPGGGFTYGEGIDEAADRLLKALTGVNTYLNQLRTFGRVNRYPVKRVITIAYYALVKPENFELTAGFTAADAKWFNIKEVPDLPYDHNEIFNYALEYLRHKVRHEPIGFNLLPKKFTLWDLQELYEAILGKALDKSNFRRKILNMNLLVALNQWETDLSHRPARLYRFDKKVYDRLIQKGFTFEL